MSASPNPLITVSWGRHRTNSRVVTSACLGDESRAGFSPPSGARLIDPFCASCPTGRGLQSRESRPRRRAPEVPGQSLGPALQRSSNHLVPIQGQAWDPGRLVYLQAPVRSSSRIARLREGMLVYLSSWPPKLWGRHTKPDCAMVADIHLVVWAPTHRPKGSCGLSTPPIPPRRRSVGGACVASLNPDRLR